MNWIRVARSIPSDPIIGMIAAQLKIRDAEVVGLVVCVLCALPDHASTGDLSGVPDATIERWALWGGKGGRFAPVFRDHMCDDNGVVGAWETARSMSANRLRNGVRGGLGIDLSLRWAFTDATVFGDGAGVRLVRPVALVDLHTEDGAVQVLTAGAVDFCF